MRVGSRVAGCSKQVVSVGVLFSGSVVQSACCSSGLLFRGRVVQRRVVLRRVVLRRVGHRHIHVVSVSVFSRI